MTDRDQAKAYAGARLVFGVLFLLFPRLMLRDILGGREGDRRVKAAGRMIGVRDAVIGVGGLVALQNEDGKAPVRPWITYGAISDAVDALALLLAWRDLPRRRRALLVLMAMGGAGTGGYLVTRIDD
ncbi:MAG TPA: hypothetical protein VF230_00130 [Acidimicrobiales bacterium]